MNLSFIGTAAHTLLLTLTYLCHTVLEAFACGIPVVVPRTQGFCDTVTDGQNGFLFEPRNSADAKRCSIELSIVLKACVIIMGAVDNICS
jgi:glycosyltransferase involved in cell wall biosynthesis